MTPTPSPQRQPIAIVGMGVLFPGAADLRNYWANLVEGRDAITDVPPRRWDARFYEPNPAGTRRPDQIACRRGGFVDDLAVAEPQRTGLDPDLARELEPEQLIALQVAAAAIEDAGGTGRLGDLGRAGVVLGRSGYMSPSLVRLDQRVRTARQLVHTLGTLMPSLTADDLERVRTAFTDALGPPESPQAALGLVPSLTASRIAGRLKLQGPAYTVDAACASSLVAVDAAVGELTAGRCDTVLAGGVHHSHDVTLWSVFSQLGVLSASQHSRPFHAGADGMLIGEGTGIVVLKRLEDALAAGDRVYAVIRGTAVASDGTDGTGADPAGPAAVMCQAWAAAGLDPAARDAVGLIEAHGAGTRAGDAAELAALLAVFGPAGDDNLAVLGSVKAQIGHAMAAAGVAGLIKAALAVHHGVLPPMLDCDQPNPAMAATRFRPLQVASPWVSAGPRRAGVSAFGFGGINAHVVLEQAAGPAAREAGPAPRTRVTVDEPEAVLRFAAPTPDALIELLDGDDATLRQRGAGAPAYSGPGSRLGLVGPTERRLSVARRVARGSRRGGWAAWRGRNDVWLSSEPLLTQGRGRIAFVFPGLEAEFAPRADDVSDFFDLPRVAADADDIGRQGTAVLRIGQIVFRALRRMGVEPDALAGHSIGEWNAMYSSGMYDETTVDDLVFGQVMESIAVHDLDYASLACPVEQALAAIEEFGDITLSHDNAPLQSIVCGPPDSIRQLAAQQRRRNVLVQILPFRSGFHTPMLAPHLGEIERRFSATPIVRAPRRELWSATLADRYPNDPAQIRSLILRHLVEPVRFRPTVLAMYEAGVRVFIQAGQGRLAGLIDDTLGHLPHLTVAANTSRRSGLDQLRRVAVALWVEGGSPRFDVLDPPPAAVVTGERAAAAERDDEPARSATRIRLELGSGLVTLDPGVLPPAVRAEQFAATGLPAWAGRDPLAQELLELLTDTADTAAALLDEAETAASPGWLTPVEPDVPEQPPMESLTTRLTVSVEAMPFLLDHCVAAQRRGWPELADLRPVVPATTIVRLMMDLAERAAPGRVAVGVYELRFERWLPAAPPTDVDTSVQPINDESVSVAFGHYARGVVRLADGYPDSSPPVWPHEGTREEPPILSGPELYAQRWLFHGPRFQTVSTILGHSDQHARAVLAPTSAPGSLLDGAGQVLAYFARANLPERFTIFPGAVDRIETYGPEPAAGTPVSCLMWVAWHDRDYLNAHFQLVADGRVWAEVNGWTSRRFDIRPEIDEAFRFPERRCLSEAMPGGWMMAGDQWADLASRDMFANRYLGAAERDELERQPPRGRRHWLLGRIAAKDAVRSRLWADGHGPVFPAEIRVANAATGAPYAVGQHGLELPELHLSIAHSGELAVAMVRSSAGVGIDIEEIREHPESTMDVALTAAERALLDDLAGRTGLDATTWFTRFWTAKEAAAKSVRTGLGMAPRRFAVHLPEPEPARADRLLVTTPSGQTVAVAVTEVSNPPHLTPRHYVVAWTEPAHHTAQPGGTS
jgi:acyl transferase domain-containing protein/phosphopantetheinyl transferase